MICDEPDNCLNTYNPSQSDFDEDGIGDACDIYDTDNDGYYDLNEIRLFVNGELAGIAAYNESVNINNEPLMIGKFFGYVDDVALYNVAKTQEEIQRHIQIGHIGDGFGDICDNCYLQYNPDQIDLDEDGFGAECDCNDNDSSVNFSSVEVCDGLDNDCDGIIDKNDNLAPTTTDNAPEDWQNTDVAISLIAVDYPEEAGQCGVAGTYYCIDQTDNCEPNLSGLSAIVAAERINYLRYNSIDNYIGNIEEVKSTVVKIDKTAPEITVLNPEQFELYTIGTALDFFADDSLSGVEIATGYLTDANGVTAQVESGHIPEPGIYTFFVVASDNAGNIAESEEIFFVVYDPEGGFATGGGWFYTDEDSSLPGGKANFGFTAKYKKDVSTGNLEFQYQDADINFKSMSIDWLAISAISAQFQGVGTINGEGLYTFRAQAKDNSEPGAGADEFDIRIWEGANTEAEPVHKAKNILNGGNIVVHKK